MKNQIITFAASLVVLWSAITFATDCDENLIVYNSNYGNQTEGSDGRKLFREGLLPYLDSHTIDENRTLTYFLASRLFHPRSNDENVFDLKEVLKSSKTLKADDQAVVAGHRLVNLSPLKDLKNLKEIAKFLYIQLITNADSKRASANLNDLTDCPGWHIFTKSK